MEQKDIVISAVPENQSDEAIAAAWSELYTTGYYMVGLLPARDGNLRAVFKLTARAAAPAREETAKKADDDERAIALLRTHPSMKPLAAAGMLAANGITRSYLWVAQMRSQLQHSK